MAANGFAMAVFPSPSGPPTWPRATRDKAKVEVGAQIVERWILAPLRNHTFFSLAELNRSVLLRLAGYDWVRHHDFVLITGATATGKTYLACALVQAACRQGLSARSFRFSRLLADLALARDDGSYPKLMDRLQKIRLLVLDDFGLAPFEDSERRDLLEVLEDRVGRQATLVVPLRFQASGSVAARADDAQ